MIEIIGGLEKRKSGRPMTPLHQQIITHIKHMPTGVALDRLAMDLGLLPRRDTSEDAGKPFSAK